MSVARWEPWSDMVSLPVAMDRLLSERFVWPGREASHTGGMALAVDVRDEGDRFEITAPVPGVKPEDVEVTILGDAARIHGERRGSAKGARASGGCCVSSGSAPSPGPFACRRRARSIRPKRSSRMAC